jgi:hypothetical protein
MSSATYRLHSVGASRQALDTDPQNRWLSHFPRARLDAEEIWDNLHAAAGTLNLKQFGPPVMPELNKEELSGLFAENGWKATKDPAEYTRRGIYLFERRTFLFPMLDAFDPPDVMTSCPHRFETTVPTQALALLNSAIAQSQAREFARRLLAECGGDLARIPARAWLLAFNRAIAPPEEARVLKFFKRREGALRESANAVVATPASAAAVQDGTAISTNNPGPSTGPTTIEPWLETALTEFCLALFNADEFVFVD